ncbi:MAG: hypothetical protein HXY50_12190 [Ignavibacteriaceae bacterium]|nr:hypothetical protein [Ignavibacteriaceae bacterium]
MNEKIYIWIIGGLLSLINFLFWSRIKRIEKDVDEAKRKSTAIEKNYLSRFEVLHNKLSEVEKNIIREIYNVKLSAFSNQRSEKEGG